MVIEGLSLRLELLMPCINWLYLVLKPRMRQFLSHWGALGQAHGDWGRDWTNVIYTVVWHHLCSECTGDYFKAKILTSMKKGGDMVEMTFGLMYLVEKNHATFEEFREDCDAKQLSWGDDQYADAWIFLGERRTWLSRLCTWRETLEDIVKGWHDLLRVHCVGTFGAWTTNKTFDGPRIANAYECLRLGWPEDRQMMEAYFMSGNLPGSFLLYGDPTYREHASNSSTAHDGRPYSSIAHDRGVV